MIKRGFTIIELVMVMVILGVLSTGGGYLMFHYIQNSVYIPNKLNMDMLVSDALDLMIDGDSQAKGLRTSKSITSINTPNPDQVTFVDQNGVTVSYWISSVTGKLYRSISGGAGVVIPYYASDTAVVMAPKGSSLFAYYPANEFITPTATAANIRWITMGLTGQTGGGSYNSWDGKSTQSTSVAVKRMQ